MNAVFNKSCHPVMQELADESVDMIFTDPPYFQYRAQNVKRLRNHKDIVTEFEFDEFISEEEYLAFLEVVLKETYRVAKPGASGYLFCADDFVSYLNRIIEVAGFKVRKIIHWHKTNPFPAISSRKMYANSMELLIHFSKGVPSTWNHKPVNEMHNFLNTAITTADIESLINKYRGEDKIEQLLGLMKDALRDGGTDSLIENPICMGKERTMHKTQKPLKVCTPFIEISSNPGDVIFDPFMGAGSTAIAALLSDRNFVGYEIDSGYCNLIQKRFDDFLAKNPGYNGRKPVIKT
ncbi:Adenine-specific methyltransferase [hydrothermal vent metagenome]|uniref:Adenine-specific methyltransferase n=1 Tax=hydrothermal vent metagenome TaxID=652676 RepID=A0A3B0UE71_9ZZZZ